MFFEHVISNTQLVKKFNRVINFVLTHQMSHLKQYEWHKLNLNRPSGGVGMLPHDCLKFSNLSHRLSLRAILSKPLGERAIVLFSFN